MGGHYLDHLVGWFLCRIYYPIFHRRSWKSHLEAVEILYLEILYDKS